MFTCRLFWSQQSVMPIFTGDVSKSIFLRGFPNFALKAAPSHRPRLKYTRKSFTSAVNDFRKAIDYISYSFSGQPRETGQSYPVFLTQYSSDVLLLKKLKCNTLKIPLREK